MSLTTREKIVITGKNLFNQNGFGSTTLYQIAQELGISRGNLTYYFKDKSALLVEIAAEMSSKYTAKSKVLQY